MEDLNVTFTCRAVSDDSTPAVISWTFQQEPLTPGGDTYQVVNGDSLLVTLRKDMAVGQQVALLGEYRCLATNGYSTDEAMAELGAVSIGGF